MRRANAEESRTTAIDTAASPRRAERPEHISAAGTMAALDERDASAVQRQVGTDLGFAIKHSDGWSVEDRGRGEGGERGRMRGGAAEAKRHRSPRSTRVAPAALSSPRRSLPLLCLTAPQQPQQTTRASKGREAGRGKEQSRAVEESSRQRREAGRKPEQRRESRRIAVDRISSLQFPWPALQIALESAPLLSSASPMPRVIRSPGRGSLVQPASPSASAAAAASSSFAHAAAAASTAVEPAKENVGNRATAAAADFRHCFQIVPACPLTHAAASDWITAQPMSMASASIPIVAAALARKTQPRPSLTEEEHAEARQQLLDHASSDSAQSLDPALLLEYDQLNDVSPALSDGRSRPDTLPSVSISEHTGTTGSKLRPHGDTATSGAGLFVGSASPHVASKEGHTPERSASERSRMSARSNAAAPSAAAAASASSAAASAPAAPKPGKASTDVFAFGSQSSQSQDSTPRSSQQPIVIPSTASAAAAPPTVSTHGTVGPSYTLPSRRVASSDDVILIPDSQPAVDAPTPSPPPSIRISASTQPSTASALAASTVAPAIVISPSSTPGDSRMTHSTRSLGATAGLTFDASVVPPTLSSLHAHVAPRQPAAAVDISFAHLDAIDSDMRRMDAEVANMDARSRLQPAVAPAVHPISQDSPAIEEADHDAHMESQAPHSIPLHPLSSSTPPLAQSSLGYEARIKQQTTVQPPPSVYTVETSYSTIHSAVHCVVSLAPDAQPAPDPHQQEMLLYNGLQSESERSGQPSEEQKQADAAAGSEPQPLPSVPAPPSHDHSLLFAATPPARRSSASASDAPMHLHLSDTPQLASASAVHPALPSSASFSSPSIGAASSRSSGGAAASHAPLPPVTEDAASLAAPPPSPPLSPRSPTLSELGAPMDEGRDAAAANTEAPSQPLELASMSLELNFDDEEELEAQAAVAAQTEKEQQQQQQADADMNDVQPAAIAKAVVEEAAPVAFPLVLNVSPLPPSTPAERPLSQPLPELVVAAAAPAAAAAASVDAVAPLPLLTPPRPPSVISPPNSAAATVVQKATPSSGRSSTALPAPAAAAAPLPALSAPADDVHSAPQHSSFGMVSPMKSFSSPAKPPSALQSPPKHLPVQRVAKQLRFGEQAGTAAGAAAAASPPRNELFSSAAAAAPYSLAPDLASASCFAVTMDSFSPCTPPCRSSFDSSSHHPSMDSSVGSSLAMGNVGVVSASPPQHALGEPPVEEEQKSGAPVAAAATAAVGETTFSSAAVVAVAWSRSRRAADEDASMEVSEIEDRRVSSSSNGAAAAAASEKRVRGKSFSKQPKSTRPTDSAVAPIDLVSQVSVVRPMLNLEKPVTISLLSESQPEESQAELSVDPVRRARATRAKKEAQAAAAVAKENTQQVTAATTASESPPVRATTSPIKVLPASASSAHVPIAAATAPTPAAPLTAARPRTPVAAAAATAIAPRSGGSSPAPSSRRSVSPLQSPLALPPPPPRTVPHHYASARKIIVHTTVTRSPTASPAAAEATRSPSTPRLGPSAAAQAARQMESPPPVRPERETKVAAVPIVNEELPQRPKFPVAPLSVILEETSSMGSFSVPAASVAASVAAPAAAAAASQRRSDSIVSRQSTSAPAAPASLPDPNAAAPMDIDPSQPAAPAAPVAPAATPVAPVVPPRPEVIIVSPTPPPPNAASAALSITAAASSAAAAASAASAPAPALPQAVSSRKRRTPAGASSSAGASESSPVDESSQASTDSKRAKKTLISAPAAEPSLSRASSRKRGTSPANAAAAAAAPASSPSASVVAAASAPTKHLRHSLLKGLVFLLTGLPKASKAPKSGAASSTITLESVTKLIVQHGGRCVDSLHELPAPADETLMSPQIVVLAPEPKRTMKFMFSLARGLPPLQPAWLHACVAELAVSAPTEAHLVPLKIQEGRTSPYPSSWLRSLRDRAFMTPLPLSKRILFGVRVAVCGPASIVSEVSVVCREAGARVWSCSSEEESQEWTAWNADSDEDSTSSLAAAAASSSGSSRFSRRSGKDASSASAASAAASSASSSSLPPVIDLVCTDSAESVSAWMQRSLAGATGATSRGHKKHATPSLPPVLSVKWLIQSLMLQKRLSDSEREEFRIQL